MAWIKNMRGIEALALVLVIGMALLQFYFALNAYLDPSAFSLSRGTPLVENGDSDWVRIYASRTLFIVLMLGVLLRRRDYALLAWAALFGTVMPVTDAILAALDQAAFSYQLRHWVTLAYLVAAFFVLRQAAKVSNRGEITVVARQLMESQSDIRLSGSAHRNRQ